MATIGIDLGTTNSLAAYWSENGFEHLSFPEGLKAAVAEKGIDRPQSLNTKPFRYVLAFSAVER